ncbi:hypothetical protein CYMTET_14273 [Cymbomonas tetramitiformis]|uniref:Amine oxidase domain-containing protein n=1 Tax=Cymbomonas tetramitiformis TaxID=36881 RepID=A0AAE0GGE6_9CHLO|nr:hypothetical protein CYMTET_14273 [Cymbomonas tetramitiformis]
MNTVFARAVIRLSGGVLALMSHVEVRTRGVLRWSIDACSAARADSPECWTLFSTNEYGRANKVPQEAVPKHVSEKVTQDMLQAMEAAIGAEPLPRNVLTQTQLWGAGAPLNSPGVEYIFDSNARIGMCGDWLLEPSVEAACTSGHAMAEALVDFCIDGRSAHDIEAMSNGLTIPLRALDNHSVGAFPAIA